ncbi:conserved Plasmodium protein, unknown function [Plasmodium berghei]|uniref:Uncharacterized protein n=2 Tax=Plasmodium berghei TaxID=5821 RepID=A0A509AIH1_PLABA|nr:conserved Plasmodium protein, unknown function [Plasmodium berghei ANKA]CXI42111.1 conserved Plasmodium protein, unknown function [Plasmodium berghei]SCM22044.1 conserved Plasmodium protein, unknown function [Plasmodium berghei]SCN25242.1 conserved Plasmodium protein, unknown function [Plasmodium berghei]SCO60231.1 conserved Plasmodium protein, unknown function [Plasmodium berghei]SCO61870.1 conserved Plasmodium protein, unknown function [Plasmodium berghei]|eukprot:XP_034421518.1 conserved Plasmodium protein, unknown function [Plasmodium berghei ANKA]
MEKEKSENYILFEGENEIKYDRFGYDGFDERVPDITSSYIQAHNNLSGNGQMKKLALGNNIGFNQNTLKKIPKSGQHYLDSKNENGKLSASIHQLQSDLNIIKQHNMKCHLNDEDNERRNKIPMLWIYNYKTIYST